jgi:hypothetical protein
MNNDEALRVMAPLVIAFPFKDDQVDLWMLKLKALTEPDVAIATAMLMIDEVESLRAPQWSVFRKSYDRLYQRHEEQERERRLALESGDRLLIISPREGRGIAAAAYAKEYRKPPPANIFLLPDPERVPTASPEDIEKALDVIRGGYDHDGMTFSRYTDVLKAFGGHQLPARAAVAALEASRQVHHHPNGTLVLLRKP